MTQVANWCFTLNNPTLVSRGMVDMIVGVGSKASYVCYGVETGQNGTPHLQGYIEMKRTVKLGGMKLLIPGAHFERRLGSQKQAIEYCQKDGDFHEFGGKKACADGKVDWQLAKANILAGAFDDLPAKVYIMQYNVIKKIHSDNRPVPDDLDWVDPPNEWRFGPTRTGKSFTARKENPGFYLKMNNKWWDGYLDEEIVLIEDIGRTHEYMGDHLKIWADKYGFRAEIKNLTIVLRPQKIVVTSNYSIAQLFPDPNVHEPLQARFKEIPHIKKWIHPMFDKIIEKQKEVVHLEIQLEEPESEIYPYEQDDLY